MYMKITKYGEIMEYNFSLRNVEGFDERVTPGVNEYVSQ